MKQITVIVKLYRIRRIFHHTKNNQKAEVQDLEEDLCQIHQGQQNWL